MDPLDDLLANLADGGSRPPATPVRPATKPAAIKSSIDALLKQLGEEPPPIGPSVHALPLGQSDASLDLPAPSQPSLADRTLLRGIQDQYNAADRANLEAQRQADAAAVQIARNRRRSQAQLWLDQLDPDSGEALWFEQFAEGYPSRLEAAIDLLEAEQHP